jgi:8-oxo-dGTP pyrophosphatase MutT (NUDIX family)
MKKAACLVLYNNDLNEVVAVNRRGSAMVGLPGGKVDPGEDTLQAAIRETWEETGIIVLGQPKLIYSEWVPGEVDYVTDCYFCEYSGSIPGGQEPDIEARWSNFGELTTNSPFGMYNMHVMICVGEWKAQKKILDRIADSRYN